MLLHKSSRPDSRSRASARRHALRLISIFWISLGMAFAAIPPIDTSDVQRVDEIDEVVVKGPRELRQAAIKAENRMLARYNELNKDRDMAIFCSTRIPTGSLLPQRYCKLSLQQRLEERDAWSFMSAMTSQDVQSGAGGAAPAQTPLAEVRVQLMGRADDFRNNLDKLLRDNPDLRELVHQSAVAYRHYEERLQRKKAESAARKRE
jgi:hypothetical protein